MAAITKDRFIPPVQSNLYDKDFYAWTQQTAQLLKSHQFDRVDLDHLIEEVEDMGKAQLSAFRSGLRNLLIHLLKLQFSPSHDPRNGWIEEVANFRDAVQESLEDNPGFKSKTGEVFADAWKRARNLAKQHLAVDGIRDIPETCPYTYEQAMDQDFIREFDPEIEHFG